MGKRIIFLLTLALGAGAVMAQQSRARSERAKAESSGPSPEQETLQRRAALRAAVQTRSAGDGPTKEAPRGGARLSPQEHVLLRQQLRKEAVGRSQ